MPHLDEFIDLLLPWDGDDANTYKVVMTRFNDAEGNPRMANAGATTKQDFINLIRKRGQRSDVWVALASYKEAKAERTRDGFYKIHRRGDNVVNLRSIFLDIDVGPDKDYKDQAGAWADLHRVMGEIGLPAPSLVVESGSGGYHVYWALEQPIPTSRWRPLATALASACRHHKLAFDSQCTVDAARVLRPPTTFNFKTSPPNPVLMHAPGQRYPVEQLEAALSRYAGPRLVATQPSLAPSAGPQINQNFITGVVNAAPPVDIYEVADAGCGVFADALDTAGAAHKQPLWHILMLAATFDQDPAGIAHAMSDGHPSYVPHDTDAMLQRKIAEKANRNLGWPSCAQFNLLHPACAACPFLKDNRTPFHIARAPAAQKPPPTQGTFPEGWWPSANGTILTTLYKGKEREPYVGQILDYPIIEGMLREDTGSLVIRLLKGSLPAYVEIPSAATCQPVDVARAFASSNVLLKGVMQPYVRDFIVAWTQKLQDIKHPKIKIATFGWTPSKGFSFAGYHFQGKEKTETFIHDARVAGIYTPTGDLAEWVKAARYVTDQNEPTLEVILAAAFAGPLVRFTNQMGLLLSCMSVESGVGKSTAQMVGQAVWGHPKLGRVQLADKPLMIMARLAFLKDLPMYWDEISRKSDYEMFSDLVFQLSQGKERGRLDRDAKEKPTAQFDTMLVASSNASLADRVTRATQFTSAGAYRCFEIEVKKSNVRFSTAQLANDVGKLRDNYGRAGEAYAAYLGEHGDNVEKVVIKTQEWLQGALQGVQEERFWIAVMATLLVGAKIAKDLNLVDFHLPELQTCLFEAFAKMREARTHNVLDFSSPAAVDEALQDLMSNLRNRHMIVTDKIHGMGRPTPGSVVVMGAADRVQQVWAQYAVNNRVLRCSLHKFNDWMHEHGHSPSWVVERLKKDYGAKIHHAAIGAGTALFGNDVGVLQLRVIDIDMSKLSASSPSPGSDAPSEDAGSTEHSSHP